MIDKIQETLATLREKKPLVLCLTNAVSLEFVANSLLALGGAPIMSHDPREAEELVCIGSSVYINLGTLNAPFVEHYKQVAAITQKEGKPLILDPVGAGASQVRTESSLAFLPQSAIVRGNASEIMALSGGQGKTLGVESTEEVHSAKDAARALAKDYNCTTAISGKEDFVTDGNRETSLSVGSPLMPYITGMGCSLTGIIAAFHAVIPDAYEAARLATAYFGLCGNIAHEKAKAPGAFKVAFIDALYQADFSSMEKHYEV